VPLEDLVVAGLTTTQVPAMVVQEHQVKVLKVGTVPRKPVFTAQVAEEELELRVKMEQPQLLE
jgi:hypothetical protein